MEFGTKLNLSFNSFLAVSKSHTSELDTQLKLATLCCFKLILYIWVD